MFFPKVRPVFFLTVLIGTVTFGYSLGFAAISLGQIGSSSVSYFCGTYAGFPATMRMMSEGNIPIIRWTNTQNIGGITPLERCQTVSARLQQAYSNGTLRYIGTGVVNGQTVICATSYKGSSSCLASGILLTPTPGTDADLALANLLDLSRILSGHPLYQNGDLLIYFEGEAYVNLETLTSAITLLGN